MNASDGIGLRGHRIQNHERAQTRRREILLAAAQVFGRVGNASATLDDVAAQMSVSRGVIYYYFRNKEELLTELVATSSGEASDRLEAIIARGERADVTLRAALRDLALHSFSNPDRYATLAGGSARERDQSWMTGTRAFRHRYRTLIRGIMEEGIRDQLFVDLDPGIMTRAVLQTALGVAGWYRPDGGLAPTTIVDQVVELALRSVRRG